MRLGFDKIIALVFLFIEWNYCGHAQGYYIVIDDSTVDRVKNVTAAKEFLNDKDSSLLNDKKKNFEQITAVRIRKSVVDRHCDSIYYTFIRDYMPNVTNVVIEFENPISNYFSDIDILSNQLVELRIQLPNYEEYPEMFFQELDMFHLEKLINLKELTIYWYPNTSLPMFLTELQKLELLQVSMPNFPLQNYQQIIKNDNLEVHFSRPQYDEYSCCESVYDFLYQAKNRKIPTLGLLGDTIYSNPCLFVSDDDYVNNNVSLRLKNDTITILGKIKDGDFEGKWSFFNADKNEEFISSIEFRFIFPSLLNSSLNEVERSLLSADPSLTYKDSLFFKTMYVFLQEYSHDKTSTIHNDWYKLDSIASICWATYYLYKKSKDDYNYVIELYKHQEKENVYNICHDVYEKNKKIWPLKTIPFQDVFYYQNEVTSITDYYSRFDNDFNTVIIKNQYYFFDHCVKKVSSDTTSWYMYINDFFVSCSFKNGYVIEYNENARNLFNINHQTEKDSVLLFSNKNQIIRLTQNQFMQWDANSKLIKLIMNEQEYKNVSHSMNKNITRRYLPKKK